MLLPDSFLDEVRARTPIQPLIARRIKLSRAGRQWKGCCPFHDEKTPSFHVYDDHFHCFGCGANGDAVGFLMRSEGTGFLEAVERLAAEAGLDMPKPTPAAAAAERRRLDVQTVLDAAAEFFARLLAAPQGAPARRYLEARSVSPAAIAAFGLGWSGDGRGPALGGLADIGADPALLAAAGLLATPDAGPPRAFFFNRLMFPIRDPRGRTIGFGGRVLGDGQPKYLNGPETSLFAKRRALYGIDRARGAARTGAPVIVVEGYLDVIALHEAGLAGAVAPLGTALTEEHLTQLWKLSPAPVLCLDGDAAGARAAARTLRLALPHLAPDRSLRIARLPQGDDPDTLARRDGRAGMDAVLAGARGVDAALFDLVRETSGDATPEQRAALRAELESAARTVRHAALASELRRALLDRFFAQYRGTRGKAQGGTEARPPTARIAPDAAIADATRARILLRLLLAHPFVLHEETEVVASLPLPGRLRPLRQAMLDFVHDSENLDAERLMNHVRATGHEAEAEALTRAVDAILPAGARPGAMPAHAQETFWHYVGLIRRNVLAEQVAAATKAFERSCDEASQRRLIALRTAQTRLHADIASGSS